MGRNDCGCKLKPDLWTYRIFRSNPKSMKYSNLYRTVFTYIYLAPTFPEHKRAPHAVCYGQQPVLFLLGSKLGLLKLTGSTACSTGTFACN